MSFEPSPYVPPPASTEYLVVYLSATSGAWFNWGMFRTISEAQTSFQRSSHGDCPYHLIRVETAQTVIADTEDEVTNVDGVLPPPALDVDKVRKTGRVW